MAAGVWSGGVCSGGWHWVVVVVVVVVVGRTGEGGVVLGEERAGIYVNLCESGGRLE